MTATLEPVPYKTISLDERAAENVRRFLVSYALHYFPNRAPDARLPYRAEEVAKSLGVARGFVSDVWNGKKKAGFAFVVGLSHATGATFEEITGIRPPLKPRYPYSAFQPDSKVAADAAAEAMWGTHDRPSGTTRAATSVRPPRR